MVKHTTGSIDYYTFGTHPRLLLIAGLHGDEAESADILHAWVSGQFHTLPPFLYIPIASPSARKLGSRQNLQGHDINRQFKDQTDDGEVHDLMRIMEGHHIKLGLDIHEDRDRTASFYVYDSDTMDASELSAFRKRMAKLTVPLFSGIDDSGDEALGCVIDEGYYTLRAENSEPDFEEGFLSKWLIRRGIVQRMFTLEVPQKAHASTKRAIIANVIPYFIACYGTESDAP